MKNWIKNQLTNAFMYVPFIMAAGAGLYFSLGDEPYIPWAYMITVAVAIAVFFIKRPIILRAFLIFIFGFVYAVSYTHILNTPGLPNDIRDASVNAVVSNLDFTIDKTRALLRINSAELGLENIGNINVRVSLGVDCPIPQIGDKINANVWLFKPSPADAPGTFDMARWMYFNGISATGLMSDFSVTEHTRYSTINSVRAFLHNRANSQMVDGLVLGYKNAISPEDKNIWTTAGIGHVWAISGFHMALVGGWLFAIFFTIFRLIAPITRRVPARKVALIAMIPGLLGYLMLSGASVSTIRAFLMTVLVAVAFIIGRNALSLRNVCLVFIVLFLANPFYIMQAGFQLSFSAVFGLIWFWNEFNPTMPSNKILRAISVAALTSLIASVFTAPFIIAHFNSLPLYGLIGNLVLLPVFSFAVMPLVIIGTITVCFGWHMPLNIADSIYNICRTIAEHITNMPVANLEMPFIPNSAIIIMILGLMAVIFMRPIRAYTQYIIFCACVLIATIIIISQPRPAFMTTYDNELVGFFDGNNITFNKARASNHYFAFDTWKQLCGVSVDTQNTRFKHDHGVYRFDTKKFNLVYIQKFVPLSKNIVDLCHDDNVDYIVSYFHIDAPNCNPKILRGGFIIYESGRVKFTPHNRLWHHNAHQ